MVVEPGQNSEDVLINTLVFTDDGVATSSVGQRVGGTWAGPGSPRPWAGPGSPRPRTGPGPAPAAAAKLTAKLTEAAERTLLVV